MGVIEYMLNLALLQNKPTFLVLNPRYPEFLNTT